MMTSLFASCLSFQRVGDLPSFRPLRPATWSLEGLSGLHTRSGQRRDQNSRKDSAQDAGRAHGDRLVPRPFSWLTQVTANRENYVQRPSTSPALNDGVARTANQDVRSPGRGLMRLADQGPA